MTNRKAAIKVVERLQEAGYEALLAGGCVRDMLLGRRAKDYDVATSARPQEVTALFRRTIQVGVKFGVVIVLMKHRQVEVATFRSDADYADGRRPTSVRFTGAEEDASRRDFTINGMFFDPVRDQVIDYVAGRQDLKDGIIRTIGDANERFSEDYLRMLRAVRFSTRLGFAIDDATLAAIKTHAHRITGISGERISMELEAILTDPSRGRGARFLVDTGLARIIFPGLDGRTAETAVSVLTGLRRRLDYPLALAGLFADCPTQFTMERCGLLKLSRNHTKHLRFLLDNRDRLLNSDMSLADLKLVLAEPYFRDLLELERAIQQARGERGALERLTALRKRVAALGDVELRPPPLLSGHDLIRLGAAPGPQVGELAEEMYIAQLDHLLQNREQAEHWVRRWLDRHKDVQ